MDEKIIAIHCPEEYMISLIITRYENNKNVDFSNCPEDIYVYKENTVVYLISLKDRCYSINNAIINYKCFIIDKKTINENANFDIINFSDSKYCNYKILSSKSILEIENKIIKAKNTGWFLKGDLTFNDIDGYVQVITRE